HRLSSSTASTSPSWCARSRGRSSTSEPVRVSGAGETRNGIRPFNQRYGYSMKLVPFGSATAPAVIAGMMRINDKDDAHVRDLYGTARDAGIDFFDHA